MLSYARFNNVLCELQSYKWMNKDIACRVVLSIKVMQGDNRVTLTYSERFRSKVLTQIIRKWLLWKAIHSGKLMLYSFGRFLWVTICALHCTINYKTDYLHWKQNFDTYPHCSKTSVTLTPIAAKTIAKLSSLPSITSLSGSLTRPACRQIWAAIWQERGKK